MLIRLKSERLLYMDVLSEILSTLRLQSVVYFQSDFSAPWSMAMDRMSVAAFHIVVRGQCWLEIEGEASRQVFAGDMLAFPNGTAHQLVHQPFAPTVNGQAVFKSIQANTPLFQGEDICTTLVCGHFEFDRTFVHPFLQDLPDLIHIRQIDTYQLPQLKQITEQIIHETQHPQPGADLMVNRLGEILFLQLLRAHMLDENVLDGYFAALADPTISKALQIMHDDIQHPWTIEKIAQKVAMSRSGFALLFKELVGMTPIAYLTNWRLLKAKEMLYRPDLSLNEIAWQVGYQSEAAFNRAFQRLFGQTPGRLRRELLSNQRG